MNRINRIYHLFCNGEKQVLKKGDSTFIAPHAVHSAVALSDSLIIDMFAPMREDFLE